MIALKKSKIKKAAYLYVALPVMCFLALYMNSWAGALLSLFFCIAFIMIFRRIGREDGEIQIHRKYVFVLALTAVAWTYLGGQGNLYYQSGDWHFRNAIYRDLLYRDWPVTYPEFHKAMVYYIGHWLPPAVLAKGVGIFNSFLYDTEWMFRIGNIFLWIWTATGVFIVECLLVTYTGASERKLLLIPLILVFFSGLDIVGVLRDIVKDGMCFEDLHIEWWSPGLQFSSLTTCLFWAFNQTVIPWIVTLCILQEKSVRNYVFLGLCAFAAGPMPFIGIVVYMIVYAVYKGILMMVQGEGNYFWKTFFSVENLLALLIMPVFLIYYRSNAAVTTGMENTKTVSVSVFILSDISPDILGEVFLFLLLEVGGYLLILHRTYKNDIFFNITVGSVLAAPFIRIGNGTDFVMRFSIPSVMVIAAMTIRFLVKYDAQSESRKDRICCIALWMCLAIGAVTACTEFMRGYSTMLKNGSIINVADDLKTMNQENIEDSLDGNIMTYDYENNIFFQYLAPGK